MGGTRPFIGAQPYGEGRRSLRSLAASLEGTMPEFAPGDRRSPASARELHSGHGLMGRRDGRMSGRVVGDRYRLQQQLGRGGMASVWRAQDTRLERSAAVKLLDPAWRSDPVALERLRREAHSVARLAHRNIVGVYDFDVADDAAYLVMELVEGHSVTELLAAQGPLPVEQAVSIAAQICDA